MSSARISLPAGMAGAQAAKAGETRDERSRDDAAKVSREFEAILVRQMLSQTNVAGKPGGYADMAVEALATSVTAAGGLGLGRAIEEALAGRAHHAETRPAGAEKASGKK